MCELAYYNGALLTMIIPKGKSAWAEARLQRDDAVDQDEHRRNTRSQALHVIRSYAATMATWSVILQVGGNVQRLVPIHDKSCGTWVHMSNAFTRWSDGRFEKELRKRQDASTMIQKHFRGWRVQMAITFNPTTTLGAYYVLRDFRMLTTP